LSQEEKGSHHGRVHYLLRQLKEEGYLEQKAGYGFRKKCCSNNQNIKQEQKLIFQIKLNFFYLQTKAF